LTRGLLAVALGPAAFLPGHVYRVLSWSELLVCCLPMFLSRVLRPQRTRRRWSGWRESFWVWRQ
jgi:hypothetical protein